MSTSLETTTASEPSLSRASPDLARYYLRGRKGLLLLTLLALGSGMYFNWGWLVAVGVAPLLLVLAPCAAMCALGLCMNKIGGMTQGDKGDMMGSITGTGNNMMKGLTQNHGSETPLHNNPEHRNSSRT